MNLYGGISPAKPAHGLCRGYIWISDEGDSATAFSPVYHTCNLCGKAILQPPRCYTCATGRPRKHLRKDENLYKIRPKKYEPNDATFPAAKVTADSE